MLKNWLFLAVIEISARKPIYNSLTDALGTSCKEVNFSQVNNENKFKIKISVNLSWVIKKQAILFQFRA